MEQARTSHIERNTKETQIDLSLNIDGKANYEISTGFLFLTICWICSPSMRYSI